MKTLPLLLAVALWAIAGMAGASDTTHEAAFSPRGSSLPLILKAIDEAQESIHVAAYSFTSAPIAKALLAAQNPV